MFRTIRLSGSVSDGGNLRAYVVNRDGPRSGVVDRGNLWSDGLDCLQLESKH
jgi:hypothetical protein